MVRSVQPFLAALLVLVGFQISARPARASETWCDTDPPVAVRTPGGSVQVVYVVDSGPAEYLAELLTPSVDAQVQPVQSGAATQVAIDVAVSPALGVAFPIHSEVWTGPQRTGTRLSSRDGTAGTPLHHVFILDVP